MAKGIIHYGQVDAPWPQFCVSDTWLWWLRSKKVRLRVGDTAQQHNASLANARLQVWFPILKKSKRKADYSSNKSGCDNPSQFRNFASRRKWRSAVSSHEEQHYEKWIQFVGMTLGSTFMPEATNQGASLCSFLQQQGRSWLLHCSHKLFIFFSYWESFWFLSAHALTSAKNLQWEITKEVIAFLICKTR